MDMDTLIEEITTKGQFGNIESELVAEQILLVPHDELKRFAHDLFFDTDDVVAYRLDCKAVKYYAEQAIARKYNDIATKVCSQLLALRKENITEQNKLLKCNNVQTVLLDIKPNEPRHASIKSVESIEMFRFAQHDKRRRGAKLEKYLE